MLTGYSIIAVPTGIITIEIGRIASKDKKRYCSSCDHHTEDPLAEFCSRCGRRLE